MQTSIHHICTPKPIVLEWINKDINKYITRKDVFVKLTSGKEILSNRKRARPLWSEDEIAILSRIYPAGMKIAEISARLGRSPNGVKLKASRLGLRRPSTLKRKRKEETRSETLPTQTSITQHDLLPKTASGRAIWNTQSLMLLGDLWKRLYSPAFIAEYLGIKYNTVCMAAKRAGLPSRAGFTLLQNSQTENPLSVAENATLAAQMITRTCSITNTVFFQNPKDRRRQHYSYLGSRLIERRASGCIH